VTRRRLGHLVLAYCHYYTLRSQVVDLYYLEEGQSMVPTLSRGDLVLAIPVRSVVWQVLAPSSLCRALFGTDNPTHINREDIVVARSPLQPAQLVVKRVGHLGGDWVGHPVARRLPPGRAWLQSDHPQGSLDSREYGPVPLGLVQARVVGRLNGPPIAPL